MTSAYTSTDLIKFTYQGKTRIINDIADNDVITITYPNDLSSISTGKNGNSLGAHNEQGRNADVQIRIVKGSGDDKFFNSIINDWINRSPLFTPIKSEFTKIVMNENGTTNNEVTQLFFGLPTGNVETGSNLAGETDQVVSIYRFKFGNSKRTIE